MGLRGTCTRSSEAQPFSVSGPQARVRPDLPSRSLQPVRSPHIHSPTGDNDNQTHHSLSTSYVPPPPGSLQDSYFHLTEEHTGSERLRTFPRPHPKPEAFLVFLVGQEVLEKAAWRRWHWVCTWRPTTACPCLFSVPYAIPQSPHLESPRASHQHPKSQLLRLEGSWGPVDSIPQPPSCDKTEAQRGT